MVKAGDTEKNKTQFLSQDAHCVVEETDMSWCLQCSVVRVCIQCYESLWTGHQAHS